MSFRTSFDRKFLNMYRSEKWFERRLYKVVEHIFILPNKPFRMNPHRETGMVSGICYLTCRKPFDGFWPNFTLQVLYWPLYLMEAFHKKDHHKLGFEIWKSTYNNKSQSVRIIALCVYFVTCLGKHVWNVHGNIYAVEHTLSVCLIFYSVAKDKCITLLL